MSSHFPGQSNKLISSRIVSIADYMCRDVSSPGFFMVGLLLAENRLLESHQDSVEIVGNRIRHKLGDGIDTYFHIDITSEGRYGKD